MNSAGSKIKSFTDLNARKQGHSLVIAVYKETKTFPRDEVFGLASQMRRCAVSVTSNIAEGFGRNSIKEKTQFYFIAQGSLTELQNQLLVARDVGYVESQRFAQLAEQTVLVHKLLTGLIKGVARLHNS